MEKKTAFDDSFFKDDQKKANKPYTEYNIKVAYITDNGILHLPTSGEDGNSVIIDVHDEIQTKVVTWSAERIGSWPDVPSGGLRGDPNSILTSHQIFPVAPRPTADGSNLIFNLSGVYTYAQIRPTSKDYPVVESLPTIDIPSNETSVKSSNFKNEFVGNTNSDGGWPFNVD